MKTLLTFGLTALVLFALSATASWLLLRLKTPAAESVPGSEKVEGGKAPASGSGTAATQTGALQRTAVKAPYTPGRG